jgi:hypothetical protein
MMRKQKSGDEDVRRKGKFQQESLVLPVQGQSQAGQNLVEESEDLAAVGLSFIPDPAL